jgi:hypothetical protein
MSNWRYLAERSYASSYLDLVKMKGLVPREVQEALTGYKAKIVEMVFDPFQIDEVNKRFKDSGYFIGKDMSVIAVNEDDSILLLGNTVVYRVSKDEDLKDPLDDSHVAFYDVANLTKPLKIKNTRAELDEMFQKLKQKYAAT